MTLSTSARLLAVGDSALAVEWGEAIDPAINHQVHQLNRALASEALPGLVELIPTYRSLLIRYDPLVLNYPQVAAWVERILPRAASAEAAPPRRLEVPTVYGGDFGPDLDEVADLTQLAPAEIIRLHSSVEYTVYMMGFTPGYPYLGKVDPAIAVPRLATPRPRVRAGSVGITGLQTGIYPLDSPGGWRIIGYTPLPLFVPDRDPPFLFAPGDRVRFVPIAEDQLSHVAQRD